MLNPAFFTAQLPQKRRAPLFPAKSNEAPVPSYRRCFRADLRCRKTQNPGQFPLKQCFLLCLTAAEEQKLRQLQNRLPQLALPCRKSRRFFARSVARSDVSRQKHMDTKQQNKKIPFCTTAGTLPVQAQPSFPGKRMSGLSDPSLPTSLILPEKGRLFCLPQSCSGSGNEHFSRKLFSGNVPGRSQALRTAKSAFAPPRIHLMPGARNKRRKIRHSLPAAPADIS